MGIAHLDVLLYENELTWTQLIVPITMRTPIDGGLMIPFLDFVIFLLYKQTLMLDWF